MFDGNLLEYLISDIILNFIQKEYNSGNKTDDIVPIFGVIVFEVGIVAVVVVLVGVKREVVVAVVVGVRDGYLVVSEVMIDMIDSGKDSHMY